MIEKYLKDNPENDLEKINKAFKAKYPLLDRIDYYYDVEVNGLSEYINLIDQYKKE